MQVEEISDNELLYMIRQNNDLAFQYLVRRYHGEIRNCLHSHLRLKYRCLDMDDFYQLALMKLTEAINEYKHGQSSFHYYYFNILKNTAIDLIRSMNTYNAKKDMYALSLDMKIEDKRGRYTLLDIIEDNYRIEDSNHLSLYHEVERAKQGLNDVELEIMRLRSMGSSYQQIADELQIPKKKVDNTLHKIRKQKKSLK